MLIQAKQKVDLSKVKRLTENHLTIHKQFHNKETNAKMYGDKFPYGTASEPTLVDRKDIKWRGGRFQTYQSRFGNGNPAHKDIRNSIHEQGLKLTSPGLSLKSKESSESKDWSNLCSTTASTSVLLKSTSNLEISAARENADPFNPPPATIKSPTVIPTLNGYFPGKCTSPLTETTKLPTEASALNWSSFKNGRIARSLALKSNFGSNNIKSLG